MGTKKATDVVAFCVSASVTGTVSIFKSSKLVGMKWHDFAVVPKMEWACRVKDRVALASPDYMANAEGGYPLTTLKVGYAISSSEPSFLTFTSIENFWPLRPLKKPMSLSMDPVPPQ
jgi:hypothetical protein